MIASGIITVDVRIRPDGQFFVWATDEDGRFDALSLKHKLFAWHSGSFYGTTIPVADIDGYSGVLLSPAIAAEFFTSPALSLHTNFSWSRRCMLLKGTASMLMENLRQGRFMPSHSKWIAGKWGWKLIPTKEAQAEYDEAGKMAAAEGIWEADEWLDCMLMEWARNDTSIDEAWKSAANTYPLLPSVEEMGRLRSTGHNEHAASQSMDEEEWLIAIGWKSDEVPFRTCLRLSEPGSDGNWRLDIVLQHKESPDHVVEYEAGRLSEPLFVPVEWAPYLPESANRHIQKWQRLVPWLAEGGNPAVELTDEQAWNFLSEASLQLAQAGESVMLPAWWEQVKEQQPRLKAVLNSSVGGPGQSMFGLEQIMQFDWKIAVGDTDLTEEQFMQLAVRNKRLVQFHGKWIMLDPALLKQVQRMMKRVSKTGLSFRDVLELHLIGMDDERIAEAEGASEHGVRGNATPDSLRDEGEAFLAPLRIEVELNEHLSGMIGQLNDNGKIPSMPLPESFQGKLRNYQAEGSSWLRFLRRFGLGGCLADDMGLGKTVQWIAYLLHVKETDKPETPALLVCPTSVLGNWQKELERFAPSLSVYLHYGTERIKGEAFCEHARRHDLVLTSYTLANLDEAELLGIVWSSLCLDEAQNIKNAYTKQSAAVRGLRANHRVALTGTPIENRLTELWSIFDFMNPGYLGSLSSFSRQYVNPIEKTNDAGRIGQVQRLVRPFLLRRAKTDAAIQLDLPDKNESKVYVNLTAEQGALYENIVQELFDKIEKLSAMERRGIILATLTRLKQLCNHPAMLLKEADNHPAAERSSKLVRLLEMVRELREEGDRCLIFTQ
ncbi:MAG: helicase, partial [Paenibacillus sp.]|nr:helicase [Paenibacillus sp.]